MQYCQHLGQTGLNVAVSLSNKGVLEKYGVELIGANVDTINKAEDRELLKRQWKNWIICSTKWLC